MIVRGLAPAISPPRPPFLLLLFLRFLPRSFPPSSRLSPPSPFLDPLPPAGPLSSSSLRAKKPSLGV
eukprot:2584542-Pyramimonas_sp.AAC.1